MALNSADEFFATGGFYFPDQSLPLRDRLV